MATTISPGAGRRYGVARVCQVWGLPRSSFYAARQPQVDAGAPAAPARRRGPKPVVSDEALLAATVVDRAIVHHIVARDGRAACLADRGAGLLTSVSHGSSNSACRPSTGWA